MRTGFGVSDGAGGTAGPERHEAPAGSTRNRITRRAPAHAVAPGGEHDVD